MFWLLKKNRTDKSRLFLICVWMCAWDRFNCGSERSKKKKLSSTCTSIYTKQQKHSFSLYLYCLHCSLKIDTNTQVDNEIPLWTKLRQTKHSLSLLGKKIIVTCLPVTHHFNQTHSFCKNLNSFPTSKFSDPFFLMHIHYYNIHKRC